jgi:hypothetical protein
MIPVIIHEDGTYCHHEGQPQISENGPSCPAGVLVTHIRVGEKVLTLDEAVAAFQSMAQALVAAISPLIEGLARAFSSLTRDPAIRALGAAAAVVEEERRREESGIIREP